MIIRGKRPDRYLIIANSTIRDIRLTFRARGVLAFVLSWPDGHRMTSSDIAQWGVEGREAVRTAFRELETAGYLTIVKKQYASGRWATTITVYDTPTTPVDNPVDKLGITA